MRIKTSIALTALTIGLAGCSYYDPYDPYDRGYGRGYDGGYDPYGRDNRYGHDRNRFGQYLYVGRDFEASRWDPRSNQFRGSGAAILDPWLAFTRQGRDIVYYRFDRDYDGSISARDADRINVWFRAYADVDRDYRLTDQEIGAALNRAVRERPRYW